VTFCSQFRFFLPPKTHAEPLYIKPKKRVDVFVFSYLKRRAMERPIPQAKMRLPLTLLHASALAINPAPLPTTHCPTGEGIACAEPHQIKQDSTAISEWPVLPKRVAPIFSVSHLSDVETYLSRLKDRRQGHDEGDESPCILLKLVGGPTGYEDRYYNGHERASQYSQQRVKKLCKRIKCITVTLVLPLADESTVCIEGPFEASTLRTFMAI
jgi:hypothetical protein